MNQTSVTTIPDSPGKGKICWTNVIFLGVVHLIMAPIALWYQFTRAPQPEYNWCLFAFMFCACGLSITMVYHRLLSHRAWSLEKIEGQILRNFSRFLIKVSSLGFGAGAAENSGAKWSADHITHHKFTDRTGDPYNIQKGFWWAHIDWVFHIHFTDMTLVAHLMKDRLIAFQHKYYVALAIFFGGVVPMSIAWVGWGDPIGGLLVGGFLRLVLGWHSTFLVNSLAHWWGRQPYSLANSARDSVITALLTFGEGFHNFHHAWQSDYRNGHRWYHFDPTKWLIYLLSLLGIAHNLKRTDRVRILEAKLRVDLYLASRAS